MRFKQYITEDITIEMPDKSKVTKKTKRKDVKAVVIGYGQSWHDADKNIKPHWEIISLHKTVNDAHKNADKMDKPHFRDEKNPPWWKNIEVKKV